MANETVIKVRVDESGTIQFFDQLGAEMKETGIVADSTQQAFSKTGASLVTLDSALNLASGAFTALSAAAATGIGAIRRGAEVDDISVSFQNLSTQAGAVGDVLLNDLSKAFGDTIPKFELMKQANELLIGGIDPGQFELLAKASRSLGEATGVSAAQGMEALSDSLLKGNDRALKTLGIVVDNKKAEEDYAASLGKTREQLTEQERVLALRKASLEALAGAQDRLGTVTDDAADKLDQMSTSIQNAKDDFLQAIANNEALNGALGDLVTTIKDVDFKAVAKDVATLAAAFIDLANLGINVSTKAIQGFVLALKSLPGIGNALKVKEFENEAERAIDMYNRLIKLQGQGAGSLKQGIDAVTEGIGSFVDKSKILQTLGVDKLFERISYEVDQAKDPFAEIIDPLSRFNEEIPKASSGTRELGRSIKSELKPAADEGTKALSDFEVEIQNIIASAKDLKQNPIDLLFGSQDAPTGESAKSITENKGYQVGLALAQGLAAGVEDGFTRQGAVDIAGSIGKVFAPEFSPLIDIGTQFLGKAVEHIFGGEHAGTTARKSADKFFADAFDADRLFVIIDGQLKQIEDLVFQGETLFGGNSSFTDGSFDNFFQGLPEAARAAFGGVGLAFEELLGTGEEISGQIGAVLANNIGGSLNNLQLLVQSSGKSFEELRGTVVEAFLDGKVSALEAQTALNGLAQVAQDGIPDAIGATIQAFDNMQAAGARGGRALIDAFKDIGFEAKELGIKDFGALAANIIASGKYSTEQVNAYFDELRRQGITNVEQLTAASTEQLLSVGSALQASGYLTEAANETAALIEGINELPSEKTFTLNVKANLDGNAQELANSGVLRELGRLSPQNGGVSVNN